MSTKRPDLASEIGYPVGLLGLLGGLDSEVLEYEPIEAAAMSTAISPLPPLDLTL